MSILNSYQLKQPVSQLLEEGTHRVRLLKYAECTSFDELKGMQVIGQKDELPEWCNPIDVLAIQVASKEGVLVHRIHLGGAGRYSELSDKQLQSGLYEDVQGFACKKTKHGLERVEDPARTESCMRILDHFLWALGEEEGTLAMDCMDSAIAKQTMFDITVIKEAWKDTDQYRISKFARATEIQVTADLEA